MIVSSQTSPYGDRVSTQQWANFAPRFGFAFDVFGDGKMSLRGGAGIYFIQPFMNFTNNLAANPPNLQVTTNTNVSFGNPGALTQAGAQARSAQTRSTGNNRMQSLGVSAFSGSC